MAAKTTIQKYGYEEYNRNIVLRKDIDEDLEPYHVELPDRPFYNQFINYGLPKEEQFFKYEEKPAWLAKLNRLPRKEAIEIASKNPEYGEWIESQWEKRRNGVFMYIYGKPLWIPGNYWFFMNYVYLQGELPEFRYPDLEEEWWWNICVLQDPLVYGGISIAMRRDAKSTKAGFKLLEAATRVRYAIGGILSKNGNDAIEFFDKNVVKAWRKLPFFFAPQFDNKTYPKKELILRDASRGGDDLDSSDLIVAEGDVESLDSRIEARTTKETAFDGEKLGAKDHHDCCIGLVIDEAGKWDDVDVHATWRIHKQCLRVRIVKNGKALVTTTVEQMTPKGLVKFKKLVDESSRIPARKMINHLGETLSGLVVWFKPAWESYVFDQWGFPIIEKPTPAQSEYLKQYYLSLGYKPFVDKGYHLMAAKELLSAELAAIEDPKDRQAFQSMYPFSLKEAFTSVNRLCPFNTIDVIQKRLTDFRYGDPYTEAFNLKWTDEINGYKVEWSEHGKFRGPRELIEHIEKNRANNVRINDAEFLIPLNDALYMAASDTFKYNETEGTKKSMGALTVFCNFDDMVDGKKTSTLDWVTEDWGVHYCFRPRTTDEYCEDAIALCHWLGCKIMVETNVDNVRQHFARRGYIKFLERRTSIVEKNGQVIAQRAAQPGVQTVGGAQTEAIMAAVDSHLDKHGMRCKFVKILEDCRDLNPDDWSPFDSFVSAGYSCYYAKMVRRPKKQKVETPTTYGGFTAMSHMENTYD